MNDLNSVLIEGTLARDPEMDPEIHYTLKGLPICTLTLNCSRETDESMTELSAFHVAVVGRQGELCYKHLSQGSSLRVIGRLRQELWIVNGEERDRVFIKAEHVEFPITNSQDAETDG